MQLSKPDEERRAERLRRRASSGGKPEPAGFTDPVDEASAESMIASDPPARSGLRLGPAEKPRKRA